MNKDTPRVSGQVFSTHIGTVSRYLQKKIFMLLYHFEKICLRYLPLNLLIQCGYHYPRNFLATFFFGKLYKVNTECDVGTDKNVTIF